PPLPPIEMATFARNQPRHWRDSRDVAYFQAATPVKTAIYHLGDMPFQETKFALIGSVVGLRETLRLARDRARWEKAEQPTLLWPELVLSQPDLAGAPERFRQLVPKHWTEIALAHLDCYACHHELRDPSFRRDRGFGYRLSPTQL